MNNFVTGMDYYTYCTICDRHDIIPMGLIAWLNRPKEEEDPETEMWNDYERSCGRGK